MSDEHLRELERRWQETGAPDDWAAFLREQVRTGTGVVRDAEAFLEAARATAALISAPAWRALALAHVALGYADLGVGDPGAALASEAEALLEEPGPNPGTVPARTLARIGRVRERVLGAGAGELAFERALEQLRGELPNRHAQRTPEVTPGESVAQRTLTAVIDDLARATAEGVQPSALAELSEVLDALPPTVLMLVAHPTWRALQRLGLGDYVRGRARALLEPASLARLQIAAGGAAPGAAVETSVLLAHELLLRLGRDAEEARACLTTLAATPALLGPESLELLTLALRLQPAPLAAADEVAGGLDELPAAVVRVAGLRALGRPTDDATRSHAVARFERLLALEVEAHQSALAAAVVGCAPEVFTGRAGIERVRAGLGLVEATGEGQEVFLAAVEALTRLGGRAAGELLDTLINETLVACGREPDAVRVLYERLGACTDAARRLSLPGLLEPIRRAAQAGLTQTLPGQDGRGVYALSLLRVGFAELALHDERAFERDAGEAFATLPRLGAFDRMFVYPELTTLVCHAPLHLRHLLARQVLTSAAAWEPTQGADAVVASLFDALCAAVVRLEESV